LESRGASAICWDDTTRDDDDQWRQKVLNIVVLVETVTSNKARDSWDYFKIALLGHDRSICKVTDYGVVLLAFIPDRQVIFPFIRHNCFLRYGNVV